MRKIIFIGRFFPRELHCKVIQDSHSKIEFANHNFEMSLLSGLISQDNVEVHSVTVPGVYSYPYNNRNIYTKRESYICETMSVESIPFVNLPVIKEVWATIALTIVLIKKIRLYKGERIDIIVNTLDYRLLRALSVARFFISTRIFQTVIVPDVPSVLLEMGENKNTIKSRIIKYLNRRVMKMAAKSDGLVILTEAMSVFFPPLVKYIVIEGIANSDIINYTNTNANVGHEIILYSGTLRKIYGVMNLVEAFMRIKRQDVELWICGSGDSCSDIERIAQKDSRIRFFGMVSSEVAFRMQRDATVLVNPRTSEGSYTKYSFPSKTIEYMLSGKDVIINRLPGIPDEYYDFVHVPSNESIEALADCINRVLDMDENTRKEKAEKARQFIVNNKNSKLQVAKILQMIDSY